MTKMDQSLIDKRDEMAVETCPFMRDRSIWLDGFDQCHALLSAKLSEMESLLTRCREVAYLDSDHLSDLLMDIGEALGERKDG